MILFTSDWARASTTDGYIILGNKNDGYAWGSEMGWLNFGAPNGNVRITDNGLTGYVWNANYGWINMAPKDGGVMISRDGRMSGLAWNDNLGWIDFNGVFIDRSGRISGRLEGDKFGVINFDCKNCIIYTDYRPSIYRSEPYTGRGDVGGTVKDPSLSHVFDIRLLIDAAEIKKLQDLSAHVTFENFGSDSTPVNMVFTVIDSRGGEIWKETNTTSVQTEAVYNRNFLYAPSVPEGKYVLRLDTVYGNDIRDTFSVPFSIKSEDGQRTDSFSNRKLAPFVPVVLIGVMSLFVGFLIFTVNKNLKSKK